MAKRISTRKQVETNPVSMPEDSPQSASSSKSVYAPASGPLNVKAGKPTMTPEQWNDMVQKKAYELFEKRGCVPGNDLGDWFEAEKMVKKRAV